MTSIAKSLELFPPRGLACRVNPIHNKPCESPLNTPARQSLRQFSLVVLVSLALVSVLIGIFGYQSLKRQVYAELKSEANGRLTLFVSNLSGILEKYEYLPGLIALEPVLLEALTRPSDASVSKANDFLESVAVASGASDVYLMDDQGLTIAASNHQLDRSFVGNNFNFRPYFKQAITGIEGRYFALGTTSLQRGYYFSSPLLSDGAVVGVTVVKITLADIESAWTEQGTQFLVTDDDGIVFLSTVPEWRYRIIREIEADRLEEIRASKRYADQPLEALSFETVLINNDGVNIVRIPGTDREQNYLWLAQTIHDAGWIVHVLTDARNATENLLLRGAIATLLLVTLLLIASLYLVNRRRRVVLQEAADQLESRVSTRTLQLQREVEERRKTEQSLRDTQTELIHAAKMAGLGEMSAGISHELNQPLTAIRTFSGNARRMLERQQIDGVSENLKEIEELTTRMAHIIRQLRGFSRRSAGDITTFGVAEAVDQAVSMFDTQLKARGIEVERDIEAGLCLTTDAVLLNQVLVNLISNAIHATESSAPPLLRISAESGGDQLYIVVSDNGTGIPEDVIDNIFDPFFTTKTVGLGLGLGLSISYRIMQNLGGSISACNNENGGACFRLGFMSETSGVTA